MAEIVSLVASWVVSTALVFWIVRRDEARLSPAMLARAWPTASRRVAIVYFGVLCLPVHFARTRRSLEGLVLGLAWGVGVTIIDECVGEGVEELWKCVAST
jgi:hypothetical protein